jgi:hypothetical protein|uniref:Uncharacterized protein n=1 Tax=Zea mays TaxID=4577 RepID=C4J3Z2_MAIZE|nr:unknown [Zea mays]|eukprot:NP_001183159.1 uncharacterized protein LOC100501529 [Zea mays]
MPCMSCRSCTATLQCPETENASFSLTRQRRRAVTSHPPARQNQKHSRPDSVTRHARNSQQTPLVNKAHTSICRTESCRPPTNRDPNDAFLASRFVRKSSSSISCFAPPALSRSPVHTRARHLDRTSAHLNVLRKIACTPSGMQ